MPSVVLVDDLGTQHTVDNPRDFIGSIYGLGWTPLTGSVAANYATLVGEDPDPFPGLLEHVRVLDLTTADTPAMQAILETLADSGFSPGGGTGGTGTTTPATTTAAGIVELATSAETITGTDATRAVTPAGQKAALDPAVAAAKARANHTGTQSLDTTTDSADRLAFTAGERAKLAGVAVGATLNATDAQLRDRSTHTGTQPSATLSDLTETVQDIVAALIVAGANVTKSYDDAAGTFTISATGGTGGGGVTDAEVVRDTIAAALVAGSGIQVTVNDASDTITVSSTAVLPTRQVIAGTGLTGGGDLSANRTLTVDLATSADALGGTSTTKSVTPAALKAVADTKVAVPSSLTAPSPLTGAELLTIFQAGLPMKVDLSLLASFFSGEPPIEGPVKPATPTGLTVVAASSSLVNVTWSPVGTLTYDIERTVGSGAPEIIRTNRAGTSFANVTGIVPDTTYTYRVRSFDPATGLVSDWTDPRSATTPPAEGQAPVLFTDPFNRVDATTLTANGGPAWLAFNANKHGIAGNALAPQVNSLTLSLAPDQTLTGNQRASVKLTALAGASAYVGPVVRGPNTIGTSGLDTEAYYTLLVSGSTSNILSIRRRERNSTTITPLSSITRQAVVGEEYELRIEGESAPVLKAYVNGVEIPALTYQDVSDLQISSTNNRRTGIHTSGTATAVRLDDFQSGDIDATSGPGEPVTPLAPLGFTATAASPTRTELLWEASENTTHYEWRRDGGTTQTTTDLGVSDAGLSPATQYLYELRAMNGTLFSTWVSVTVTTPSAPVSAPPTPTGLQAVANSSSSTTASWNASTSATTYDLERNGVVRTGLTSTFVNDSGLLQLTQYSYRVRAVNSAGPSAWSAVQSVTTPAASTGGGKTYIFGMTDTQIKALPMSGAAWDNMRTNAQKVIDVNMNDFSNKAASHAFAAGLYYVRTGDTSYRTKVINALEEVRTWSGDYYYSAVYRQMAGWVFAADLVGHRTTAMVDFFDQIRYRGPLVGNSRFGKSMWGASWDSPNNHGAHARGAFAACSAFVGDTAALAAVKKVVNRWLGPDGASDWGVSTGGSYVAGKLSPTGDTMPDGGRYTLTWAHDPVNWYGINPATATPTKEGAVVMDIEREATAYSVDGSGKPVWGGSGEQYSYGALIGTMTAMIVLASHGYPSIWSWSDNAALRARKYLHRYGSTYTHSSGGWLDHFFNKMYTSTERGGVTFTLNTNADSYGYGYTNWLMP